MDLTQAEIKHMVETMTPEEIKTWVQEKAFRAWKANSSRGTLEMATGTGKTRVALLAAHAELQINPAAMIVIATVTVTMRDTDWPKEMDLCGLSYLKEKIIRVCWVSLAKLKVRRDVDLFIADEIHHLTDNHFKFLHDGEYRIFSIMGLTALVPDKDGWDRDQQKWLLINSIAPVCFKVPLEQAIELKLVADFEVTVLLVDLDDKEKYLKVEVGTKGKKTTVMMTEVDRYRDMSSWVQKTTVMAQYNKAREGMRFAAVNSRVQFLSNLRQKAILARDVMKHVMEGNRTLIFCGSIDQSVELCGKQVYNSETTSEYLDLFQEEKIHYLGVCQALNEGKNINNLDQILVVQLNSKELNIIQRIGRVVRWREGHKARVIVLVARNTADEQWYREAFSSFSKHRIKEYHVKPEGT